MYTVIQAPKMFLRDLYYITKMLTPNFAVQNAEKYNYFLFVISKLLKIIAQIFTSFEPYGRLSEGSGKDI